MKVYLDGQVVAEIWDNMSIGDTIISGGAVYEIITKTIDLDNSDLYCKVRRYLEDGDLVCDVFRKLYRSPSFITSGPNTNEIEHNPRILVLFIVASVVIDGEHLKKMADLYKTNAITLWNQKEIDWNDIFIDNPRSTKNVKSAAPVIKQLLLSSKIPENLWPIELRNQ